MQMSIAHSFQHRQSMVVTAQLQQAITLLQMGNTELQSFIDAQAEENPFVEPSASSTDQQGPQSDWAGMVKGSSKAGQSDDWDRIAALADDRGPSLYAHAAAQIEWLDLTLREGRIAEAFLDALEPSGWLGLSVAEIAANAAVTEDEALAVLAKLHRMEPAGLFARDLAECLRLQAEAQGILTPAFAAVLRNLPLVAAADLPALARACKCMPHELRAVLRQLRSLDPKPGARFDTSCEPQTPPDLIARRDGNGWQVELNRSTLPSVVIRKGEDPTTKRAETLARPQAGEGTARYVAERLSVARWLARAVAHRNETALRVGAEIVRRQQGFMEHGPSQLRPMTLREVADAIAMHESTVSRVCSGMMMQTPQGTFPLRHFFTAALSGREGEGSGSAGAVRHRIRQLVFAENPADPLSDDAIAQIMANEGVTLARRTVAKYREMLGIPSSSARRRRAILTGEAA